MPSQRAGLYHNGFSRVVKSPLHEWGGLLYHYTWPKEETHAADRSNEFPRVKVLLPVGRVTEFDAGLTLFFETSGSASSTPFSPLFFLFVSSLGSEGFMRFF